MLKDMGATEHDTITSTIPNSPMKQVSIGVYGICSRIGVAKFELQLSRYIYSLSKFVLCTEGNTSNHHRQYSFKINKDKIHSVEWILSLFI